MPAGYLGVGADLAETPLTCYLHRLTRVMAMSVADPAGRQGM